MEKLALALTVFLFVACSAIAQSSETWHPITQWSASSFDCPGDKEKLEKAAQSGDTNAQDTVGSAQVFSCAGWEEPAKNLDFLRRAATSGNVHAQITLGEAYRDGKTVTKDPKEAANWFERASKGGDPRAINDLGVSYATGEGVTKNDAEAIRLYLEAAEKGLPEAQYNAATMFDDGRGITQDYETARKWYTKAANQGKADAAYRLGLLNERGLGGAKDPDAASEWFKKAAENGSEDAQVRLGLKSASAATSPNSGYFQYAVAMAMIQGKEIPKDEVKGILFLQKAADAGYPPAMVQLGIMFEYGQGTAKDEAKAEQYFRQAIARDSKNGVAYNDLAWLYVTASNLKIHDARKALDLATKAVELTGGKNAPSLDTLAHAYFELGNLDLALENESRAAELSPKDDFIQKTLAEYKSAREGKNPKN